MKLSFAYADDPMLQALSELPGVRVDGQRVKVPRNAADLITAWLDWPDHEPVPGAWQITATDHGRVAVRLCATCGEAHRFEAKDSTGLELQPLPEEVFTAQFQPTALGDLTDYQRDAIAASSVESGFHFWMPAGSGKTRTALISALLYPGPVLEVTKSGPRLQHQAEAERVTRYPVFVLKPTSEIRKSDRWRSLEEYLAWCRVGGGAEELAEPWHRIAANGTARRPTWAIRPVVIAGWESLVTMRPALAALVRNGTVIYDESHKGKNHSRWLAIRKETEGEEEGAEAATSSDELDGKLRFEAKENITAQAMLLARAARRRLLTTATPVAKDLSDMWAQLDLAEPFGWGGFWDWAKRYCAAYKGPFGWKADGQSNAEELAWRLGDKVAFRVDKEEVRKQLPPFTRRVFFLEAWQQDTPQGVKKILKEAAKRAKGGGRDDAEAWLQAQLMEACARKRSWVLDNMDEWLGVGNGKVLCFAGFHKDIEDWADRLSRQYARRGKPPGCGGANDHVDVIWSHGGSHDPVAREALRRHYQAHPGPCIFIASGPAWGESYDLQDTDVHVNLLLPWTPMEIDQREGRTVGRLGRQRPVQVIYPICRGTKEEAIAGVLAARFKDVRLVTGDEEAMELRDLLLGGDEQEVIDGFLKKLLEGC